MGHDKKDLTDLERADTYKKVFESFAFNKPLLSLPRLILIAAQPGAGKSRAAQRAEKEFSPSGSAIMADIDETRPFHPHAEEIFAADPFKLAEFTNKDCWGWTSQLLLDARHAKNNIVYQATIRNATRISDLIKDFQNEGFAVDLHVVAVNTKQSIYGIFNRFEDAIIRMNMGEAIIPRWVPIPFHNTVYRAFPYNVDYLAENARLERVGVFSRDGGELYLSEGRLIHRGAGDALMKEQQRVWSPNERLNLHHSWQTLIAKIESRPEGTLKPKWYVRTAALYSAEAAYAARAQLVCAQPAPSSAFVAYRTPNHHFVHDPTSGFLISYERPVLRGKTAILGLLAPSKLALK